MKVGGASRPRDKVIDGVFNCIDQSEWFLLHPPAWVILYQQDEPLISSC